MANTNVITQKGYDELSEELQNLKENRRSEVAQKIKEAREQGDLSENAEYDAAKEEQRQIEERIAIIENILKNAEIVSSTSIEAGVVGFGSTVVIKDLFDNKEYTYMIVGSSETDILNNKISNISPLGSKLVGSRKGETITFVTPDGSEAKYKVVKII